MFCLIWKKFFYFVNEILRYWTLIQKLSIVNNLLQSSVEVVRRY
jgi:hypothetical protein